jgi:FlaA1/EpsC-like NDP-sugar epimerase
LTNKNNRTYQQNLRAFLIGLSRPTKRLVNLAVDSVGFAVCGAVSAWLLTGTGVTVGQMAWFVSLPVLIALPMARWHKLYLSIVRYVGFGLLAAGAKTAAWSAVLAAAVLYFAGIVDAPFRWATAFWALTFIYICGSRYVARAFLINTVSDMARERVIIYGAGASGAQLATGMFSGGEFLPVAMIDDDPALSGKVVGGLVVYAPTDTESLIRKTKADRVLLAIPSASRRKRGAVLERLTEFPVHVQTIPEMSDLVTGKARVDEISDVKVEDLLGRNPVPPDASLLGSSIYGKNVMVTGAGGSIGSELCRQIIALDPSRLVVFDLSEPALYDIDKDLKNLAVKLGSRCEMVALLGSVHHGERVRRIMETFSIQTVYHAAAYKHVPIVEQNLFEGIYNNVLGTLHTVRAAIASGVETFVLISTDKAVAPTNAMGATKRFAELILQAYASQNHKTRLCMVRFGNVLESSGSVVPLFREQIRNGGPVTVTHRDIIRYFMTIPEAAQLVIQAASMARGGDVFVLDMGEPVKIRDLAYRMINMMGLTARDDENPDGDIEIKYTGLRPAEKLYEELLIGGDVIGTEHPGIMRANEDFLPFESLAAQIDQLVEALQAFNYDLALNILLSTVREYTSEAGISDLEWIRRQESTGTTGSNTVIDFRPSKRST